MRLALFILGCWIGSAWTRRRQEPDTLDSRRLAHLDTGRRTECQLEVVR